MQLATRFTTPLAHRARPPSALLRALLPRARGHVSYSHTCCPHSFSPPLQSAPSSRRNALHASRPFRQRIITLAGSERLRDSPADRLVSADSWSQLLPSANDGVSRVLCRTERALAWLARELAERIGGEGEGGSGGEARGSGERSGGAVGVGDVVCLQGDVGAGKTTFCRHLIRALTGDPHLIVTSPTFLLLNSYPSPALTVHHYDAYRLGALRTATPAPAAAAAAAAESPDIQRLDLAHSLATGLCLIEWPQPLLPLLPAHRLHLSISLLPPAPHPPGGTHEPDVLPMGRPTAGVTGGAAEGRAETGEEMIGGEEGREGGKRGAEDGEEWEEQGGWEHEEEEDAEGEWWRVVHLDASGEPWTAVIDAVVASARLSPLVTIL
ncbi:unnamed protein product [Closterium sp. NIES-64]|nr:unnamed protein product [Closterium sp. NIES-64]